MYLESGSKTLTDDQVKDLSRWATRNADLNTVVLGRWSDDTFSYNLIARENGFKHFDMGSNWNLIRNTTSEKEMWRINMDFLDDAYKNGDSFVFSENPGDYFNYKTGKMIGDSSYAKELDYLYNILELKVEPKKVGGLWQIIR